MRAAASRGPVLGILGGMGPAATADFLQKLIRATPARRDQDHLPAVICSLPQIPDRTNAILHNGPSPLPAMLQGLALLENCGVNRIAIPCNTAHHWYEELRYGTSIPIVHIVDAVAWALRRRGIDSARVGLLGTTATMLTGLYSGRLRTWGLECVVPDAPDQASVMRAIGAVKAGGADPESWVRVVREIAARLFARGAATVVLACSELPLLLSEEVDERFLDATDALARACVRGLPVDGGRADGSWGGDRRIGARARG